LSANFAFVKNRFSKFSLRELALSAAIVVGLAAGIPVFFYFNIFIWLSVTAIAFLAAYFIFYFILNDFIYSKIKIIYKNINKQKSLSKIISADQNPLEIVNAEVEAWREEKEEEIAQLRKLEVYRKEFVANVSHELKTPLFNIQGYIHTLLDGAIDDLDVNRNFLEKAVRNIERLINLVADLETISQLETGGLQLETETFDLHMLVGDVFESLDFRAANKKIRLSFGGGSNQPVYVSADKDKIRQVLVNLIDNSIKYGCVDGNTEVSFYDMHENILTEIADDGIGVEEHQLPRLFERFYRADKSRSREQGGTGLGLSIVKHIIEAHGQTISARRNVVGTTFSFTLKKAE
jgi:two-component system, OmpR family, phosphate regulon sensor histidine kinase PhoR